jgi:hypothetical protein
MAKPGLELNPLNATSTSCDYTVYKKAAIALIRSATRRRDEVQPFGPGRQKLNLTPNSIVRFAPASAEIFPTVAVLLIDALGGPKFG